MLKKLVYSYISLVGSFSVLVVIHCSNKFNQSEMCPIYVGRFSSSEYALFETLSGVRGLILAMDGAILKVFLYIGYLSLVSLSLLIVRFCASTLIFSTEGTGKLLFVLLFLTIMQPTLVKIININHIAYFLVIFLLILVVKQHTKSCKGKKKATDGKAKKS